MSFWRRKWFGMYRVERAWAVFCGSATCVLAVLQVVLQGVH